MTRYSRKQKEAAIARMLPPQNQSINRISEEMGIPPATLYLWRKKAREGGAVIPNEGKPSDRWGSQAKFRVVVETSGMAAAELSAYCRERGIYPDQVKAWRRACEAANAKQDEAERARKAADKALKDELKAVRRELRRKEKALAETAALLALRKKMEAIWGEDGDA